MNTHEGRKFAVITGASSGIGYEFAKVCAEENFQVLVVADHGVDEAAERPGRRRRRSPRFRQTSRHSTAMKASPRRYSRVPGLWTYWR